MKEKIDINKITLLDDDKNMIKDYLYYIGFWNKHKIIDEDLRKKIDYKFGVFIKLKNMTLPIS